jgi:PKD repeat protein
MLLTVFVILSASLAYANNPPVADAGPDIHMYLGEATLLDGSAWDPDGDPIVWWEWTVEERPAGSTAELPDPNRPNPIFTPDMLGDYVFYLVVTDGSDESQPDSCSVTVDLNLPPVCVIVVDRDSGCAPLLVQFDGSQSYDPEGRPLAYEWHFGDLTVPSHVPSPNHEYIRSGRFDAELRVTDDIGQLAIAYLTIQVDTGPSTTEPSTWGRIKSLYR